MLCTLKLGHVETRLKLLHIQMTFYSSLTKHVAGYIYRPTCNAFENCCDPSLYYSQLGKVLMETDLVVYVLLCSYIIYSLGLVLTAVCKPGGGQVK